MMHDDDAPHDESLGGSESELPHRLLFIGLIKRATVAEARTSALPHAFAEARELLLREGEAAMERAVALVAPYFQCTFDACNVGTELGDYLGLCHDEHRPVRMDLQRLEFQGDNPFPAASGSAWFEVPTLHQRSADDMEAWQEENSYLDSGLRFHWSIPGEPHCNYEFDGFQRLWLEYCIAVEVGDDEGDSSGEEKETFS
jgi:hypothetical protein